MARGGEILKFMGDGFFAIFPTPTTADLPRQVNAAMEALAEGRTALDAAEIDQKAEFRTAGAVAGSAKSAAGHELFP